MLSGADAATGGRQDTRYTMLNSLLLLSLLGCPSGEEAATDEAATEEKATEEKAAEEKKAGKGGKGGKGGH